jgi:hypothetical protein
MERRIKRFDEFLKMNEGHEPNLRIEKNELDEGLEYEWILEGRKCGYMLVSLEKGVASIAGYAKYGREEVPSGYGARFIKMCINDLLSDGYDVVCVKATMNATSGFIWDRLKSVYDIEDSSWRGSPCLLIRSHK